MSDNNASTLSTLKKKSTTTYILSTSDYVCFHGYII